MEQIILKLQKAIQAFTNRSWRVKEAVQCLRAWTTVKLPASKSASLPLKAVQPQAN